jgi:outer membrane immunogenic protein
MEKAMHKGTMRSLLAGFAASAIFSGAAMAADISRPVYKAPPAGALPVTYDWTGFYVGGHVGYGWAHNDWRDAFGLGLTNSSNGFLGGGQAGFNYQIGQFVLGAEGDFSWSGINGGSTAGLAVPPPGASFNTDLNWISTLTGRAGIAFDRWLVYGKGGVAWANSKFSTNNYTFPAAVDVTDTRIGWTAGAGVEYAFAPAWSAKLEYNYLDFGDTNVSFAPGISTNIDQQIHAVKLGINYKFGFPGATAAHY